MSVINLAGESQIVGNGDNSMKFFFFVVFIFGTLWSCNLIYPPKNILTEADITSIEANSDTSVLVKIGILVKSTAETCELSLFRDTVPPDYGIGHPLNVPIGVKYNCEFEKNYDIVVGGLLKNKKYYYQIQSSGTFDIGGPNQYLSKKVGTLKEYTIH
jgi:hypothetical protein